jgi:transcriptional regulator with XRE-family HTH domain
VAFELVPTVSEELLMPVKKETSDGGLKERTEEGQGPSAAKQDFGRRVKLMRGEKKWTLEQLSVKSRLSISALSKIENGQVSASFDTIVKIAHAFGHSFGEFIDPAPHQNLRSGRRTTTRSGGGLKFHTSLYDYDVHSAELTDKGMIPLVMRIKAREVAPLEEWSNHDGEEFIYVISGTVDLHTEVYAPLRLSVGDSAYIDSTMRHSFVSVGETDAGILSICMTEMLRFAEGTVGKSID